MSRAENVEIVRRVYAALNRDDWDGAFDAADPDFEATFQRFAPGTHRGRERVQAILVDARTAFDAWIIEPVEIHESGDQVVAVVRNRLRPKGSEAEIELRHGHVWTVRDGRVLSWVGYPSPEDALEAAGLRE